MVSAPDYFFKKGMSTWIVVKAIKLLREANIYRSITCVNDCLYDAWKYPAPHPPRLNMGARC
eukprot:436107-Pleurochrysis_carterae.AAC.2